MVGKGEGRENKIKRTKHMANKQQMALPEFTDGSPERKERETMTKNKESEFRTTDAHEAIFHDIVNRQINVQVRAVAGSGKSTTVIEASRRQVAQEPSRKILVTAFNKDIVTELEKKAKKAGINTTNITFKTMNSLGTKPTLDWMDRCGAKRPPFDGGCTQYGVYAEMLGDVYSDPVLKSLSLDVLSKVHGTFVWNHPEELLSDGRRDEIITEIIYTMHNYGIHVPETDELPNQLASERDMASRVLDVIKLRISRLFKEGEHGYSKYPKYSFDEQITFPLMFNLPIGKYDLVIVDEAQDLNRPKQHLLRTLAMDGAQVVAVGDPHQAIYAFAGADYRSMDTMKEMFEMKIHGLPLSYRIPRSVQAEAARLVPHIECLEDAPEGEVIRYFVEKDDEGYFSSHLKSCAESGKYDDAMIVGRFNAQLMRLSSKMLRAQARFIYVGRDIGKPIRTLINDINAIQHCSGKIAGERGLLALICEHSSSMKSSIEKKAKKRGKDPGRELDNLRDTIESVEIISRSAMEDGVSRISDIVGGFEGGTRIPGYIDKFIPVPKKGAPHEKGVFRISTIHKAKGLEADTVIVWGHNLMPSEWATQDWEMMQEKNMEYVAVTRAKSTLELVSIEKW